MNKCQIFPVTVTGNMPVVAKTRVQLYACVPVCLWEGMSNNKKIEIKQNIHKRRQSKLELANKGSEGK